MRAKRYSYEVLAFRNNMCEKGIEYTPEEAEEILNEISFLIREIQKTCFYNHDALEYFKNITTEDKHEIINELESVGINMNIKELEGLIDLVLQICN